MLNELPAPVAIPATSAPPVKVPVGIIVGFVVGALAALLIAGALAYHFLPELFRVQRSPRALARAKLAELRLQDMDVPLLYPVGALPPPPPPLTDEIVRRAEEVRRASVPGSDGDGDSSGGMGTIRGSVRPSAVTGGNTSVQADSDSRNVVV